MLVLLSGKNESEGIFLSFREKRGGNRLSSSGFEFQVFFFSFSFVGGGGVRGVGWQKKEEEEVDIICSPVFFLFGWFFLLFDLWENAERKHPLIILRSKG